MKHCVDIQNYIDSLLFKEKTMWVCGDRKKNHQSNNTVCQQLTSFTQWTVTYFVNSRRCWQSKQRLYVTSYLALKLTCLIIHSMIKYVCIKYINLESKLYRITHVTHLRWTGRKSISFFKSVRNIFLAESLCQFSSEVTRSFIP